MNIAKPKIVNPKNKNGRAEVKILQNNNYIHVVDTFEKQLEELFLVRHPKLKLDSELAKSEVKEFIGAAQKKSSLEEQGIWVFFPWNNIVVHILSKREFYELHCSRNQNLITKEEQQKLRNSHIGIVGLSVGNSAALVLALEGAETMRLADFDELSLSNLNRIRGSVTQLGLNKTLITARQIFEINPYSKLKLFQKGMSSEMLLKKFIAGPPKLDVLIDEMDDVIMKIRIRVLARTLRIPVISVADNGDSAIADVERFDLEPARPLYHNLLGDIEKKNLSTMNFREKIKLINDMVGVKYVASRMKQSLLEVGDTLYSWPQLGGAAMLSGATIAYLVKKIALQEKLPSGKYDVNLDRIFDSQYDTLKQKNYRKAETREFLIKQRRIFSHD